MFCNFSQNIYIYLYLYTCSNERRVLFNRCNIYIYIFECVFGLFVCLYPINAKSAEPIGPKFGVGPQERFMGGQN